MKQGSVVVVVKDENDIERIEIRANDTLQCSEDEQGQLLVEETILDGSKLQSGLLNLTFLCDGTERQPSGDVELCFWIEAGDQNDNSKLFLAIVADRENLSPSTCDEDPPLSIVDSNLIVEDKRTRNGTEELKVCGKTTHFTDFGVFLGGENGIGGKNCNSSSSIPFWLWIVHIVTVSCCFCTAGITAILMWKSRKVQRLTMGAEGERIVRLRQSRERYRERTKSRLSTASPLPEGFHRYQYSRNTSVVRMSSPMRDRA